MRPNYLKIYTDLINYKYPEKKDLLQLFKGKQELTTLDILTINNLLFEAKDSQDEGRAKHKAYDIETIHYILKYQRENLLTNTAISRLFKVSRNTVAKWKKQQHKIDF